MVAAKSGQCEKGAQINWKRRAAFCGRHNALRIAKRTLGARCNEIATSTSFLLARLPESRSNFSKPPFFLPNQRDIIQILSPRSRTNTQII